MAATLPNTPVAAGDGGLAHPRPVTGRVQLPPLRAAAGGSQGAEADATPGDATSAVVASQPTTPGIKPAHLVPVPSPVEARTAESSGERDGLFNRDASHSDAGSLFVGESADHCHRSDSHSVDGEGDSSTNASTVDTVVSPQAASSGGEGEAQTPAGSSSASQPSSGTFATVSRDRTPLYDVPLFPVPMPPSPPTLPPLHSRGRRQSDLWQLPYGTHATGKPDLAQARQEFNDSVYLKRKGRLLLGPRDFEALGPGITLYMRLQRLLIALFATLSLCAVPTLLLAATGSRIRAEDADQFGLGRFTLGNIGVPDNSGNTTNTAAPAQLVALGWLEMRSTDASLMLTTASVLGCAAFIAFMVAFSCSITREARSRRAARVTDYAVLVTGLPSDATREEVLAHFSGLYDLSTTGWTWPGYCGRCRIGGRATPSAPVPGLLPVVDCANTGNPLYVGRWVCEVTLVRRNGDTIRAFGKVLGAYARVKATLQRLEAAPMHEAARSEHAKARRKLTAIESKLARLKQSSRAPKAQRVTESGNVMGAFVTFQHPESAVRARRDYLHLCTTRCQPRPLRFRGLHRLHVVAAPPPSDVQWENLESSKASVVGRQACTAAIALLALLVSFSLVLTAHTQKAAFTRRVPDLGLCPLQLPALAFDSYSFPPHATLRRVRARDHACGAGRFHLEFYDPDNATRAPAAFGSCSSNCVAAADSTTCTTLDGAHSFPVSTIAACYCMDSLKRHVGDHGVLTGAARARDAEGEMCDDSLGNFALARALLVVAVVSVVVVNGLLHRLLTLLARFERHVTLSHEQQSITFKVFVAQLLNTAVTVLVIHARLPNVRTGDLPPGVFSGDHDGFGVAWYPTVGVSIMLTMAVQATLPHASPLLRAAVCQCRRRCVRRKRKSHSSLQRLYSRRAYDLSRRYPVLLNTLFVTMMYGAGLPLLMPLAVASFAVGYAVDLCLITRLAANPPRYDKSLAVGTLRMLPYALVLHLCFTVWMFGNSEVLDSGVIDPSLLDDVGSDASGASVSAAYEEWRVQQEARWDSLGVTTKLVRENVFPLFLLLVLLVVYLVLRRLALAPLFKCAKCLFHTATCGRCARLEDAVGHVAAGDAAAGAGNVLWGGFTCEYSEPVPLPVVPRAAGSTDAQHAASVCSALNNAVDKNDRARGTRLVTHKDATGKIIAAHRTVVWTDAGASARGVWHRAGTALRVWEVLDHSGSLYSYHPLSNPKYLPVFRAMREVSRSRSSTPAVVALQGAVGDTSDVADVEAGAGLQVGSDQTRCATGSRAELDA